MLQTLSSIAAIERRSLLCKAFWKRSITETYAPVKKPPIPGSDTEKDQAAYYDFALQLEQSLNGKEKELFVAFAQANQKLCEHSCCEYFSEASVSTPR